MNASKEEIYKIKNINDERGKKKGIDEDILAPSASEKMKKIKLREQYLIVAKQLSAMKRENLV